MRNWKKGATAIALSLFAAGLIEPEPAQAQWAVECVNCSDWWTQLTEYAEEIETAVNTLNSYEEQVLMYENMVKQGELLPAQFWGTITADINSLNTIVATGTNIAYATSNIASKYSTTFPSYTTNMSTPITQTSASNAFTAWAQQNVSASNTSLQTAQQQAAMFNSETSTMSSLQGQSAAASGTVQALQAGNEMNAQEVQQLQKLRQLIMTQMNMVAQQNAAQTSKDEEQRAIAQQWLIDPTAVTSTGTPTEGGLPGYPTD